MPKEIGLTFFERAEALKDKIDFGIRFRQIEWKVPGIAYRIMDSFGVQSSDLHTLSPDITEIFQIFLDCEVAAYLAIETQQAELIELYIKPHYRKRYEKKAKQNDRFMPLKTMAKDLVQALADPTNYEQDKNKPWIKEMVNNRIKEFNGTK